MKFEQFKSYAKKYKTVPVYEKIHADLLTPISAYMRIMKDEKYTFLLESVEKGTQYSRYSFLGIKPTKIISHKNNKTTIIENGNKKNTDIPFVQVLKNISNLYKIPDINDIPNFTGGLVGYLGYETISWFENIPIHNTDENKLPDSVFMLYEDMIAFDHLKGQIIVFSNINVNKNKDLKIQYKLAKDRINAIGVLLHNDIDYQTPKKVESSQLHSNMKKSDYVKAVKKIKEYIKSGDIFQLVLSQCFHRSTSVEPINIYRALRSINPSPYMFYIDIDDFKIIGASPELLVKVENNVIEIRPIAGTKHRGKNLKEDNKLAEDLLADQKEQSEHLMLVDLARNDVGRTANYGSIKIDQFMKVENYSHVMHIVSDVKGTLKEGKNIFDALFSGFPAGTVSGAPKIRAMEIIYELEPNRRNIYSGAIGYLDFMGNINTCIAIRTLFIKDKTVFFQSGAGIVNDSIAEKEYEETINKAQAIINAIDFAEGGLV